MDIHSTIILLTLILTLAFLIRKPYFNFPMDEDAGFHTYIPYFYNRGFRVIKDYWGGFPMFFFVILQWLYKSFKQDISTIRIFATLIHLLTILSIYYLVYHLSGNNAALLSALLYAVYASAPFLTWFSIHAENYYLLPVTWGLHFYLVGAEGNEAILFLYSGLFFSAGFLLKIVVAGYAIMLSGLLIVIKGNHSLLYFLIGFIFPITLYTTIHIFLLWGQNRLVWFQMGLRMTSFKNISDLKWIYGNPLRDFKTLFFQTAPLWIGVLFFFKHPENLPLLLYASATLIIFILQKGYSAYHYLPVIHLLSIASASVFWEMMKGWENSVINLTGIFLFFLLTGGSLYHIFSKYYFKEIKDCAIQFEKFDQYVYLPLLAEELKLKLSPSDRIYVWGAYTQLYQMTGAPAPDKYIHYFTWPYSGVYSHFFDTVIEGIRRYRPIYIVLVFPNFHIDVLKKLTGLSYSFEKVFLNRFRIYRLIDGDAVSEQVVSKKDKLRWLERLTKGSQAPDVDPYYLNIRDYNNAKMEAEKAISINPLDWRSRIYLGIVYRTERNYGEALKIFEDVSKNAPEPYVVRDAVLERGITFREMGKYKNAFEEFSKNKGRSRFSQRSYLEMGVTYREMNEHEKALVEFEKVPEESKIDDLASLEKGITYREMGRHEEGLKELERIKNGSFVTDRLYLEKGITYRIMNEHKKALSILKKGVEEFPDFKDYYTQMGIVNRMKGDLKTAIDLFLKGADTHKSVRGIYNQYLLASSLEEANRFEEALECFVGILASRENALKNHIEAGCYFHIGRIYDQMGSKEKARKSISACLLLIPCHGEARRMADSL